MSVSKTRRTLSVFLFAAIVCTLSLALFGCGSQEPASDMTLGAETEQAVYMTNATGKTIVGVAVAEEGSSFGDNLMAEDAALADGQVAKIFVGTPVPVEDEAAEAEGVEATEETAEELVAEEAAEVAPEDSVEAQLPNYDIQVTFDDGTTATLYSYDSSLAKEFSFCFEDEVAFITYTDGEGNEVSTKDEALALKEEMERKAAEEAAAAASQQQYYYYNSYGADSSAGQGQTGCLF